RNTIMGSADIKRECADRANARHCAPNLPTPSGYWSPGSSRPGRPDAHGTLPRAGRVRAVTRPPRLRGDAVPRRAPPPNARWGPSFVITVTGLEGLHDTPGLHSQRIA